jgi:hypothetical protein
MSNGWLLSGGEAALSSSGFTASLKSSPDSGEERTWTNRQRQLCQHLMSHRWANKRGQPDLPVQPPCIMAA